MKDALPFWVKEMVARYGRIILVTGSRKWTDKSKIDQALTVYGPAGVLHGGAAGADWIAAGLATRRGWESYEEPPDYRKYGANIAPKIRNQKMVDALDPTRDLVLAFPLPDSRGTRDCMERARLKGVTVHVFE